VSVSIRARLYDLLIASPLIVWYMLGLRGFLPQMLADARAMTGWVDGCRFAAQLATILYMLQTIVLLLVRRLPQARSQDNIARAVAVAAANLQLAILILPRAALSPPMVIVSAVLTAAGLLASIGTLAWLGRSFSILPQARGLITSGPYRYVRHPLYAAEFVASLGSALLFAQPWSLLITLAAFALQLRRMQFEEVILFQTYPEYGPYRAQTARLLPGIY